MAHERDMEYLTILILKVIFFLLIGTLCTN